ncbi:MAG: peptide chain release factor 2 [Clostridiales bacterium]|nr:peptide chain release factor 2 [Clostridiales bacterium]
MSTVFDVEALEKEIEEKREESLKEEVYTNPTLSSKINKDIKVMSEKLEKSSVLQKRVKDTEEFIEMMELDGDQSMIADLDSSLDNLYKDTIDLYMATLLSGQYDNNNAIVKIHSGAGGTEACDWAGMLNRMYEMFSEKSGFRVSILDSIDGDGAGIKSITLKIEGEYAYGMLKGEMGVHRLVRISPFDSNKRRHTSFASVEVMPELDQTVSVEIKSDDLKVDVYRSGGAGGQHVNTTDSAVRITHLPTGIVVACQNERSQLKNRETAMSMLKSKLISLEIEKKMQEAMSLKGDAKKIEWGSQIRSYVFCPYTMVKDHRTGTETSAVYSVMDGNIKDFVFSFLKLIN